MKQIYKIFQCLGCYATAVVPISHQGSFTCEHEQGSTGTEKRLLDVVEMDIVNYPNSSTQ